MNKARTVVRLRLFWIQESLTIPSPTTLLYQTAMRTGF